MSLSKELCLRSDSQNSHSFSDSFSCLVNKFESKEDNYRRDSFSDVFCDDLCEEIIQYLPLKEKPKLEGMSKQFQRTVFKLQYELHINISDSEDNKNYLQNKDLRIRSLNIDFNYFYNKQKSVDSLKALLKKCPNITSIEFDRLGSGHDYDPQKVYRLYRLIIENCKNLSQVNFLNDINDSYFEELRRLFAQKIKYLRSVGKLIDLNLFPNIEKVILTKYVHDHSIIPQLKLPSLKQLEISIVYGQEYMLQTYIDTFPTLTHLNLYFYSRDENAIYESLKNISNLKNLIHFQFYNEFGKIDVKFLDLLTQMTNNSQNLKSIDCRFNIDQNSNIRQLLSELRAFPALKRLSLRFYYTNNEGEDNIDVNQLFSFELFKGFENITHLNILRIP